jgi:2-dehydropantoate 2-reductase
MKILIAGIGGVGGYFGGRLAKQYEHHPEIDIYFLARGEHLQKIREEGLKVVKGDQTFIAHPKIASANPLEFGEMDVILFCTKGYDLESTARMLKPCVTNQTIIIPLLNGVDAPERIQKILPCHVTEGCVYIISRKTAAGIVENASNIQKMFFGIESKTDDRLVQLEKIFREANIEATATERIRKVCWEKFIFISPLATATSFYNASTIGGVREEHADLLLQLIHEVHALARAKHIGLDEDIIEKTLVQINGIPFEYTTSMQRDTMAHPTMSEVDSLTKYVVVESEKVGLIASNYALMCRGLSTMR